MIQLANGCWRVLYEVAQELGLDCMDAVWEREEEAYRFSDAHFWRAIAKLPADVREMLQL